MAAPTVNAIHPQGPGSVVTLETWDDENLAQNDTITGAFSPPTWATDMILYLSNDVVAGTTGLVDFKLETLDPVVFDVAEGVAPLGDWDGITQVTNTTNQLILVEVGPDVTADDTGSATASCRYGVRAILPKWVYYTIARSGADADEDYTGSLRVEFKKR